MAVKNTTDKIYTVSAEALYSVLRDPDFSRCIDAELIEEAIMADGVEFRFVRKTTMQRYGRNYYIKVRKLAEAECDVAVMTQSRKVTVLFDIQWKDEVQKVYGFVDMLLRR